MLVEFSVVPMGRGASISRHVAKVVDIIDKSGLPYKTHAMGTLIEGNWEECMRVIKKCHDALKRQAPRVYTRIAIDDKKGKKGLLVKKLDSVESKLGRSFSR
jgi:uncharacterized protein (TIGR00106 family)